MLKILVTGGAGFIGSAVVRELIKNTSHSVLNLDALTYAGNLDSVAMVSTDARYQFAHVNLLDVVDVKNTVNRFQPHIIMHLAAESHVDRSIDSAGEFIQTNIVGTFNLLEAARHYYLSLEGEEKLKFRFHHISTDEVYGDLTPTDPAFTEENAYEPSSPYSASKAASDHLVRAWGRTYHLPVVVTNCSNNYGPYHFPEKLIPHTLLNALHGKPITVYGDGQQIRDWLYVEDHARALIKVATQGEVGETYNIGGHNEVKNIDVVHLLCDLLEKHASAVRPAHISKYHDLITFVKDRPGHDHRYAINAEKIKAELGWVPEETFATGLEKTVLWYLQNEHWWKNVISGGYRLERLGQA